MGIDLHGQDVQSASEKAVKDATNRSCLCGLKEILNIDDLGERVLVKVTVAVSRPEEVVLEKVAECLPVGRVEVRAVVGGLKVPGLFVPEFGDKDDSIEAAVACVEVWVVD
jgi:uncharacterized protein (TIGR02058 family)